MKLKIHAVIVAACLLVVASVSAAIPSAENLLPSDTLAMFTVPDYSTLSASWHRSPQYLLWEDPAMKPFHDDFMAKWNTKFMAPLEQSLGIKVSDYFSMLQGQFTLAITQNGWDGSDGTSPAMLLLLDAKDKSDLLASNLADLKQQWKNSGKPVRTVTIQDIKFSVVSFPSNAPMPFASAMAKGANGTSSSNTLYIGQFKSLLIAGTTMKAVEGVAAHLNGGANPTLVQNAQFASDQLSQFHNAPLYYGWFNAKTFFSVLAGMQSGDSSGLMPSMNSLLLASGAGGLKSVSFSYHESHEGSQIELFAAAPETARRGLLKILTADSKDANPPPFVPADAIQFFRWRVDGQRSWDELEKTLTSLSPGAIGYINSLILMANATAQQQNPSFDLRKDLIGNLGDDWIKFSKAPPGRTLADLNAQPYLFLFAANNPDQAIFALKTVGGMMSGGTPQSRDFLGRKIYTITLPSGRTPAAGAPAAPKRSIYCTASGGYVAITTDVSMIENYLRSNDGKTKPLNVTPGLVEAAQHVGGMGNGLFGYQNQRESARVLFSALKNDPASAAMAFNSLSGLPVAPSGGSLRDLANFSLLPDYGAVAKYFSFTVYGGSSSANGLDLKIFEPRPPGLN
jgi:hypothetical protein